MAFHDLLTNKAPVHRRPAEANQTDRPPPKPNLAWLFDGQKGYAGVAKHILKSSFGPFAEADGQSINLAESRSSLKIDAGQEMDAFVDLTVSFWIKGGGEHPST